MVLKFQIKVVTGSAQCGVKINIAVFCRLMHRL